MDGWVHEQSRHAIRRYAKRAKEARVCRAAKDINVAYERMLKSDVKHAFVIDVATIGNAAAAIQGSPVTTMDIDFMFRKTSTNLRKLKALAADLDAMILRPFYPASQLYRITRDRDGLQLDFMAKIDGIRSYEAMRSRALLVLFGECEVHVADLRDVIRSKERAGREQDLAVLPIFGARLQSKKTAELPKKKSALRLESDRALVEQIRRLLALPPNERTHFLRVRLADGGSAL